VLVDGQILRWWMVRFCVCGWTVFVLVDGQILCLWMDRFCVSGWTDFVLVDEQILCWWMDTFCVGGWIDFCIDGLDRFCVGGWTDFVAYEVESVLLNIDFLLHECVVSDVNFEQLLRGEGSFGDLLAKKGFRSVPSPDDLGPNGASYFSGIYHQNTKGFTCMHK
jgi:hypothetical protein